MKFNRKVLRCNNGNVRNNDALMESFLLAPFYYKALKDLPIFANIVEGKYNVDTSKNVKIGNRKSVVLSEESYEKQIQYFRYSTGFRFHVNQKSLVSFTPKTLYKS